MGNEDSIRPRMPKQERRRQLLSIGLQMLVDRPIQELSIDEVAEAAGISRGLLFHYFPTKTNYYEEVIAAALRRVWRNVAPDPDAPPEAAVQQFAERFYSQIERRRDSYVALVFGNGDLSVGGDGVGSHRRQMARELIASSQLPQSAACVVHAWIAYVEDRALQWSAAITRENIDVEVSHCVRALDALLAL